MAKGASWAFKIPIRGNDAFREDGSCLTDRDCEADGNSYIHPACIGYGVCGSSGQCGWQCGDATCRDL